MDILFTEHSKERMKKRGITFDEVIQAIKNPNRIKKLEEKYCAQKNIGRANIEVVYLKDKYIKIITVYYV